MSKFGCPLKFVTLVSSLHDRTLVQVLNNGQPSDAFPVTNWVKQGCVLAPTMFSILLTTKLSSAFSDNEDSIKLCFHSDENLFNPGWLQAQTRVKITYVHDLLFADDCILNVSSEAGLQQSMNKFSSACDTFGLTISTQKMQVMCQQVPNTIWPNPRITVKGNALEVMDKFTYIRSVLSKNMTIDNEVNNRLVKASTTFGRLSKNVWDHEGLSAHTKLKVYNAVVLSTFLFAFETQTLYSRHVKKLNQFHLNCLHRLLHIQWWNRVPDTEVLNSPELLSIHTYLHKAQLQLGWPCAEDGWPASPKVPIFGELTEGKRSTGGQKRCFKETLQASLKDFSIDLDMWDNLALDIASWWNAMHHGTASYKSQWTSHAIMKRAACKAKAACTLPDNVEHVFPHCGRLFHAPICLVSHLHSHQIWMTMWCHGLLHLRWTNTHV